MLQFSLERNDKYAMAVLTDEANIVKSWLMEADKNNLRIQSMSKSPVNPGKEHMIQSFRYPRPITGLYWDNVSDFHVNLDGMESRIVDHSDNDIRRVLAELNYYLGFDVRRKVNAGFYPAIEYPTRTINDPNMWLEWNPEAIGHEACGLAKVMIVGSEIKFVYIPKKSADRTSISVIHDRYLADHVLLVEYSAQKRTFFIYIGMDTNHHKWFMDNIGTPMLRDHPSSVTNGFYQYPAYDIEALLASEHDGVVPFDATNPLKWDHIAICPVPCSIARGV